ncbi:hypothetical protein V6N13_147291 [Hibiscus sabdariffa]
MSGSSSVPGLLYHSPPMFSISLPPLLVFSPSRTKFDYGIVQQISLDSLFVIEPSGSGGGDYNNEDNDDNNDVNEFPSSSTVVWYQWS